MTVQQKVLKLAENNKLRIGINTILSSPTEIQEYLAKSKEFPPFELIYHIMDHDKFRQDINREFKISISPETYNKCNELYKLVVKIRELTGLD